MNLRPYWLGIPFLYWVLAFSILSPQNLTAQTSVPVNYTEDFESQDPFVLLAAGNTQYTINYKGLSTTRASHGNSAFKLDVTFATPGYGIWAIKLPQTIAAAGTLTLSGDIYIESTAGPWVGLGNIFNLIPTPYGGLSNGTYTHTPVGSWITQHFNLVADAKSSARSLLRTYCATAIPSDLGITVPNLGLFFYVPVAGRIVVYIDNLQMQGTVPVLATYQQSAASAWSAYKTRIQNDVYSKVATVLAYSGGSVGSDDTAYISTAQTRATAIKTTTQQQGFPATADYNELSDYVEGLGYLPSKVNYLTSNPNSAAIFYPWNPITFRKVLPFTNPVFANQGDSIALQAARGEFEPASFVIQARAALTNVSLNATDLQGPDGAVIPKSALNLRLVKAWYQAGNGDVNLGAKTLQPELLLNDDELVRVNLTSQTNLLRIRIGGADQYVDVTDPATVIPGSAEIHDASTLQPFSLTNNENKQIWLTARVPDTAPQGTYLGQIAVSADSGIVGVLKLSLTVLPWTLPKPDLDYALYYRGYLPSYAFTGIGSEQKTPAQFRIEMQNMINHGVSYPDWIQSPSETTQLQAALDGRQAAGLPKDKIFNLETSCEFFRSGSSPKKIADLQTAMNRWKPIAANNGWSDLYFYGIDEAFGTELKNEQDCWKAIHQAGFKVLAAISNSSLRELLGGNYILPDIANITGGLDPDLAQQMHALNKRVYVYGNPQAGVENPEIYRRNYGFAMWDAGYDGEMDYAYQHAFGHIWNDFDSPSYRDHVFAYPTSDGVIDTVEFEGFREAVDDIRYLSLLKNRTADQSAIKTLVKDYLATGADLSGLRVEIARRIRLSLIPTGPQSLRIVP